MSRRSPITRAAAAALPLPGIDAGEPIAPTTATPANDADARAIRRARTIMADFGPSLRAAMEPALRPLARLSGDESAELDDETEATKLEALDVRTDLVCSVAQGLAGWELRVARTLWEGVATVRVAYSAGVGVDATFGTTDLVCRSGEELARRVTGWMARFEGPVRVASAHTIDVDVDGRAVISLRWSAGVWSADDTAYRAELDAALAVAREAETDVARADAIDTAHAHALQQENAAGLSLRSLDDEKPAAAPAPKTQKTHDEVATTTASTPPRKATARGRALRVVGGTSERTGDVPGSALAGSGEAPRATRERKAARSEKRGART